MEAITQSIDKIAPAINAAMAQYDIDRMQMKTWEACLKLLRDHPLLIWKAKIPPNRMGVHFKNRGGLGIVASKALSLGAANCANGYSYSMACKDAFASSMPPKGPNLSFNEKLNERQHLPPLMAPLGVSLGSGHGNGFLRLVDARAPCGIATIAPSGVLDPEELGKLFPGLGEAVCNGLEFTVIHYEIFERWPKLADIIQKALNSKNMQTMTETEGLVTMATSAQAFEGPINWDAVQCCLWKRTTLSLPSANSNPNLLVFLGCYLVTNLVLDEALHAKPHWQPWARSMASVLKVTTLELVHELGENVSALIPKPTTTALTSLHLGGQFFDKVASFKLNGLEQCPRFRMALLTANFLSPPEHQDSGKCILVKDTHVAFCMQKKHEVMIKTCEKIMDTAREVCANLKIHAPRELGRLDSRIVYHAVGLGQKSGDAKAFANLDLIVAEFMSELSQLDGGTTNRSFAMSVLERKMLKGIGPKNAPVENAKSKKTIRP